MPESIIIEKEGKWYIVRNKRTGVASQGRSPGEARENLKEAVSLYTENHTGSDSRLISE